MSGGNGSDLFDFAVVTIFAREFLEGAIIIGQYRTIILRGNEHALQAGVEKRQALRQVHIAAVVATLLALVVIAAIAIPLYILSSEFDDFTSKIIEGVSKIVAALCLLSLSLKIPKLLGLYGSCKKKKKRRKKKETAPFPVSDDMPPVDDVESGASQHAEDQSDRRSSSDDDNDGLSLRSIRFNVAWNIWREVAECGVFLIPVFLTGDGMKAVPLSAAIGAIVGLLAGYGIYVANQRFKNRTGLAIFAVCLLVFLSAGLFTGGVHNFEMQLGSTRQVWEIKGDFWDVHRLPMTILKPFGYNSSRTILEVCCYWGWLALSALLHYVKWRRAPKVGTRGNAPIVAGGRAVSATGNQIASMGQSTASISDNQDDSSASDDQRGQHEMLDRTDGSTTVELEARPCEAPYGQERIAAHIIIYPKIYIEDEDDDNDDVVDTVNEHRGDQ